MSVLSEDKYLSVEDIMFLYGITRAYVYKLACMNEWRRIKRGTNVFYYIDDIDDVLGEEPG